MFSKATVIAFAAALGAVNASPLLRRQETGVTSLISSAVSSAVSSATEAVSGASSAASSAVSTASGAASSAVATATSDASSAVAGATSTGAAAPTTTEAVGTERYPAYPCAPGYLLTYAQVNQTLEGVPVTQAGQAAGEWATSPLFPNVTNATGGTEPGATHTISVMGISINEVLVNATANATSGYAQWTWNNTGGPVSAGPVTLDTYQTVFRVYDPDFTTTQEIGNTTFVQIFTNACANDQAAAAPLLETLGSLELGLLGAALSNATAPAATTAAEPASSAAETATSAVESASSAATSAVESTTSAVSSAASGAAASATSIASAATSAAAALTSTSA